MVAQKEEISILLDPGQYSALAQIAQQENRSVSDVVSDIVGVYLDKSVMDTKRHRAMQALENLTTLRKKIEACSGCYQGDLIAEARAQRAASLIDIQDGGQ